MTIYEMEQEYLRFLDFAESEEVDEDVFNDTKESLIADIEGKAEGYAKVIKQLEADAAGIDAEIKRLAEKKKSIENNSKRLKQTIQQAMELTGSTKFKTSLFSFTVRNNAPSLFIKDESMIPSKYKEEVVTTKIDKVAIKKDIKNNPVEWAELVNGKSLLIK